MNIGIIIISVIMFLVVVMCVLWIWARPKQPPVQATAHKTDGTQTPLEHKDEHKKEHDEECKEEHKQGAIQKCFEWIWAAIVGMLWAVVPIAIIVIAVQMCSMRPDKPIVQKSLNPYAKTWTMVITAIDSSQRRLLLATKVIVTKPSTSMLSWHYNGENHLVIFNEELGCIGKWDDGNQQGFFRVDGYDASLTSLSDWESEIKGDFWDDGDDPNQPAPYRFVLRPNPW